MDTREAYSVLGLREGAGEEEVKAAYRALAQKYSPDAYEAGPLREDAEAKMNELNEAFDTLMGVIRTGQAPDNGGAARGGGRSERFRAIRQELQNGSVDQALEQLKTIAGGENDAEWNFLTGSAYYYKGWLAEAMRYFETACRLAPQNREYAAALRNLQSSANGGMPGSPYGNTMGQGAPVIGCSCCDMCTAMMCMDMCCSCGRGGC